MIVFPESVLRKQLNAQLKRGKILTTELILGNKPFFKRLILLNNDFQGNDVFYIITTSKVDWYKKYGKYNPVKGNFIYINKGQTIFNPNKDMIIDFRRVDFIKMEKLLENYKNRKLRFLGDIPNDILMKIDNIILNSVLIPPKIKRKIINI